MTTDADKIEKITNILEKDKRVLKVCRSCGAKQGYVHFHECIVDGHEVSVSHDYKVPDDLVQELSTLLAESEKKAVEEFVNKMFVEGHRYTVWLEGKELKVADDIAFRITPDDFLTKKGNQ